MIEYFNEQLAVVDVVLDPSSRDDWIRLVGYLIYLSDVATAGDTNLTAPPSAWNKDRVVWYMDQLLKSDLVASDPEWASADSICSVLCLGLQEATKAGSGLGIPHSVFNSNWTGCHTNTQWPMELPPQWPAVHALWAYYRFLRWFPVDSSILGNKLAKDVFQDFSEKWEDHVQFTAASKMRNLCPTKANRLGYLLTLVVGVSVTVLLWIASWFLLKVVMQNFNLPKWGYLHHELVSAIAGTLFLSANDCLADWTTWCLPSPYSTTRVLWVVPRILGLGTLERVRAGRVQGKL